MVRSVLGNRVAAVGAVVRWFDYRVRVEACFEAARWDLARTSIRETIGA